MNAIPEDIQEEEFTETVKIDPTKLSVGRDNMSGVKKSCEESEIDGLIRWAKDLPDDIASHSQSSFMVKIGKATSGIS
jgi:hypothetical protein